jgi:hypothetical protein
MLEESQADIAKITVRGARVLMSLVHVPIEILRRIGYYIVEVDAENIKAAGLGKFEEAGFEVAMETDVDHVEFGEIRWDISVAHSRRVR